MLYEVITQALHARPSQRASPASVPAHTKGPSTWIARTLARMLDVPFSIADATALTEAGYVGEDVENILLHLIQSAAAIWQDLHDTYDAGARGVYRITSYNVCYTKLLRRRSMMSIHSPYNSTRPG